MQGNEGVDLNKKTITIRDVAQLAGVSTATVSRTLSNPDVVAQPTRDAVMSAVKNTGYSINHAARNLRKRRTGNIVALVPNIANPFFSQILWGIESVLTPAGYSFLVADTQADSDPEARLARSIDGGHADGLVLLDGGISPAMFASASRPPIVMACEWIGDTLPSVRADNIAGADIAIRHLWEFGHRKIGYLTGPQGNVLTISRLAGTQNTIASLGGSLPADWIFEGDFGLDSGAFAGRKWCEMTDKPTAVFCASDEMACGFIGAVQRGGFRVPDDVSVIGFDNIEVSAHLSPGLTTIHQPRRDIGNHAARMLLDMIENKTLTGPTKTIPVHLITRESVAAPK